MVAEYLQPPASENTRMPGDQSSFRYEPREHIFRLIDLGGEIVRAAVVGMELLHEVAVRGADLLGAGALVSGRAPREPPPASSRRPVSRRACSLCPRPPASPPCVRSR